MTHPHDSLVGLGIEAFSVSGLLILALAACVVLFMAGAFPIPIGYERGRVKWILWCGTGMHAHVVYRWPGYGFQSMHPKDRTDESGESES